MYILTVHTSSSFRLELNSKVEELTGALLSKEQELDSLRNDMELAKASREASIKDGEDVFLS